MNRVYGGRNSPERKNKPLAKKGAWYTMTRERRYVIEGYRYVQIVNDYSRNVYTCKKENDELYKLEKHDKWSGVHGLVQYLCKGTVSLLYPVDVG